MSEPATIEYAKIGVRDIDSSDPFVTICGVQTTGFNRAVQTSDRFVKDCAFPGRPAERRVRVTGRSRTLTGSGLYNADQRILIDSLEGVRKEYQLTIMDFSDGGEAGVPVELRTGPGIMTSINMGSSENDLGTIELTIESDGAWTSEAA
jgi:hypothetical protein